MTSTATHRTSSGTRWPIIVLAIIGFVAISPVLLGLLFAGLAITAGLAALAIKVGGVALIVWAVVMLFKGLFGSKHATPPGDETVTAVPQHVDLEAELERHRREHLASLDQELERAVARKNAEAR